MPTPSYHKFQSRHERPGKSCGRSKAFAAPLGLNNQAKRGSMPKPHRDGKSPDFQKD